MGYFNFYILKEIYKKNKKLINKILIFFAIFFIVSILKSKCFAFEYNADHYIEWQNDPYYNNKTIRICAGTDFIIIPNKSNSRALNAVDIYTGKITPVSVYANGVDMYDHELSGSWFLTDNAIVDHTASITAHKGYYVVYYYSNNAYIDLSYDCPPFIHNLNEIIDWSFTDLELSLGHGIEVNPNYPNRWRFTLYIEHNGTTYSYNVNNYLTYVTLYANTSSTTSYDFHYNNLVVPKYTLLEDVILKKNDVLKFTLKTEFSTDNFVNIITDYYNLGSINYGASDNTEINNNLNSINNSVQQTTQAVEDNTQAVEDNTQAVEHLEQTITDSTVNDDSVSLPTISVDNPTQAGIDQVFTQFYNAFCTGNSGDIVFPIPNTNKNITLPGNFVYNMLHSNGGDFIINFVTAFWWYTIGSWVVRDIWDKIFKIQEGEVENIQTSNIKADML